MDGCTYGHNALSYRVGIGYDAHRLVRGRELVLGGVKIPFEYGLLGHSDADVIIHAIVDALIGAMGLGDIGRLFPDSDPSYKDIPSRLFLGEVYALIKDRGYAVNNIDVTLLAERPKIAPYAGEMRELIARELATGSDRVSIKATTQEGLGFVGRGEGMAALAIASLFVPA